MKCLSKLLLLLLTINDATYATNLSYENMARVFSAAVMHMRCYFYANPTMSRFNQIFYEIKSIMQSDEALKGYKYVDPTVMEHITKALQCQIKYEDSNELARSCFKPPRRTDSAMPAQSFGNGQRSPRAIRFITAGTSRDLFQGIAKEMRQKNITRLRLDRSSFPIVQLQNGFKVRLLPVGYQKQHLFNANLQRQQKENAAKLRAMKLINCKKIPDVVESCLITRGQTYTCRNGIQKIRLNKLCNGKIDCNDGSDERICYDQVKVLLKHTIGFMHKLKRALIETECIQDLYDHYSELSSQISYMEHIDDDNERAYNDIVSSVNSVHGTIKALFCFRETLLEINTNVKYKKYKSESLGDALIKTTCLCKNGRCPSPCLPICNITCERRYALSQYSCADGAATSVPVAHVCDGFPDCDDRSDEANCNFAHTDPQKKITAQKTLQSMLKNLQKLIASHSNFYVLPQLITFQKNIVELQRNFTKQFDKQSMNMKSFESLGDVFPKKVDTGQFSWDSADELYNRLSRFNEELMYVYKIVPRDVALTSMGTGCPCDRCLKPGCSDACVSACKLQGSLPYYPCRHSVKRIRLEALCDGTANCFKGDDEENCRTGKCKRTHFNGLLSNLRIGKEVEGNIGKALSSWKENVKSKKDWTLATVTNPAHYDLVQLVKEALRNLTVVYGSVASDSVEDGEQDFKKLVKVYAANLIQNIKKCQ